MGGLLGWLDSIDKQVSESIYDPSWRVVCKVCLLYIVATDTPLIYY